MRAITANIGGCDGGRRCNRGISSVFIWLRLNQLALFCPCVATQHQIKLTRCHTQPILQLAIVKSALLIPIKGAISPSRNEKLESVLPWTISRYRFRRQFLRAFTNRATTTVGASQSLWQGNTLSQDEKHHTSVKWTNGQVDIQTDRPLDRPIDRLTSSNIQTPVSGT